MTRTLPERSTSRTIADPRFGAVTRRHLLAGIAFALVVREPVLDSVHTDAALDDDP